MDGHVAPPESSRSFSHSVAHLFGYSVVASKERLDSSDNIIVVVYLPDQTPFVEGCEGSAPRCRRPSGRGRLGPSLWCAGRCDRVLTAGLSLPAAKTVDQKSRIERSTRKSPARKR